MPESFEERRKHIRINRNFILTYSLASNPSYQQDMSQINNISQGGINFSATEPLVTKEQLCIELKAPFLGEPVFFQGMVVQCHEKVPGLIYEIGVQFNDVSEQGKEVLRKIEQYANKEA